MTQGAVLQDHKDMPGSRAAYAARRKPCAKESVLWVHVSRLL